MTETLVGIDFGTTNTVISYFDNNKSHILQDGLFKIIPSKIGFFNEKIFCGNYIPINCNDIIHSFKLDIGHDKEYNINNVKYCIQDLLLLFFQHIKNIIIKNLNNDNIQAVITVPSNFNDNQREIIKNTFENIGINIIRIINEPSAAALAYGLYHSTNEIEKFLVIDIGGGTMDFTVLEKTETLFEIIHSCGLNDLGGNNFTQLIYNDFLKSNKNLEQSKIWYIAQKIKEKLTYLDIYESNDYILTKNKFENMCQELLKKIESTLTDIINNYEINYIVLVGGTSRIPMIHDIIKKVSNKNPWVYPSLETVVAEGASLYAGIIKNKYHNNEDVILLDVLPLSLGVELVDGTFSIIIPKNTPLPVKRSQKYTTNILNENSIKIKVYQGERKIANKNYLIGEFIFDKVSQSTQPIIEVIFKVDLNSIINITIIDKKSGVEKNIIIKDLPIIESSKIEELINQAQKLSDIDNTELQRCQNIYIIKSIIENSLANISINNLMNQTDKDTIIKSLNEIEEKIDSMNDLQLVETVNYLQEKFSITGSCSSISNEDNDDNLLNDNFQKELSLHELKVKIELLLAKNPDWSEFLNPVLEELSYNTVSIEYINQKLELVNQLEDKPAQCSKTELNNLCIFLKSQIESGEINLGDNNKILIDLINHNLNLLTSDNNDIDWTNQLNELNTKCEELYNF
jgi:molecular chaperone DnaK